MVLTSNALKSVIAHFGPLLYGDSTNVMTVYDLGAKIVDIEANPEAYGKYALITMAREFDITEGVSPLHKMRDLSLAFDRELVAWWSSTLMSNGECLTLAHWMRLMVLPPGLRMYALNYAHSVSMPAYKLFSIQTTASHFVPMHFVANGMHVYVNGDQGFLDALKSEPLDQANWLIYADWLEEQGRQRHRVAFIRKWISHAIKLARGVRVESKDLITALAGFGRRMLKTHVGPGGVYYALDEGKVKDGKGFDVGAVAVDVNDTPLRHLQGVEELITNCVREG